MSTQKHTPICFADFKLLQRNNQKGFTLMEIVITIGIVAIISIFILQLFITAKNLNQKANDLDNSLMISTSIIELFKSGKSPQDIENNALIKSASIDKSKDQTSIHLYYDADWNPLQANNAAVAYTVDAVVTPAALKETQNNILSQMFHIRVDVLKTQPYLLEKKIKKEIYSIEGTRYFNTLIR